MKTNEERFKEFAGRVRESEIDLRSTIVQQQDIVRAFMQSLEEEAEAQRGKLAEKEREVEELEKKIEDSNKKIEELKQF